MYIIKGEIEFEWDDGNQTKIEKRFSILQVEEFFNQELLIIKDVSHSVDEDRYIAVGVDSAHRAMFVCFTYRLHKIRVISARMKRRKEHEKYKTFKKNF